MIPVPALILFIIFNGLAALHLHWALGGKWGFDSAIPTKDGAPLFKPGRALTLLVAAGLFLGAILAMWRGLFPHVGPAWVPRAGIWTVAVLFALRAVGDFGFCGVFKRIRGTRFARNDSLIYSPLCIIISGLALWLALRF